MNATTDAKPIENPLSDRGLNTVPLSALLTEVQAGFATAERDPHGTIQVRMNNVTTAGTWDWSSFIRVPLAESARNFYALKTGDVLFNNTNSTELVGKTALYEGNGEPVVFSNHFTRLRTNPALLDPAYLAFWLLSLWRQGEFARLCDKWIGQSAVQRKKLVALSIPLRPLVQQKRIAECLREQLAQIQQAHSTVEQQLKAAQSLATATLSTVFRKLESLWPRQKLGDVLNLRKEVIHPRNQPTGNATFVGLEHIESNTGRRIGSLPVDMAKLTGRKPQFFKGDIVYGYLRPYLNKVWIAEFDGLCSVDQYVYSVDQSKADTSFIAWFMRSPVYLERAPVNETPGWLPRIRTEEVASVEVILPPLLEQQRIRERTENELKDITTLNNALAERLKALDRMPGTLLREAFSGKI